MTLYVRPRRDLCAAACVALIALLACAITADARTFFVGPRGHDWRSGRTPGNAWRTVNRVNRARLRPGDVVAFRGGSVFSDAQLTPYWSGTSRAVIRFTSYGKGRATLTRGVWFRSISWIQFDDLRFVGADSAILSGYGSGARFVRVFNDVFTRVGVAVNSAHPNDYGWTIAGNNVSHTRDSGIIIQGRSNLITYNLITHTGLAPLAWARHGIYSKGPNERIVANRILGFSAQGISTRYRNAFISGNRIQGGPAGIGYWQQDDVAGTTVICGNTIGNVHYGVLIGPQSGAHRERFRILDNHIATNGGPAVYNPSGRAALDAIKNVVSRRNAAKVRSARVTMCKGSLAGAADASVTGQIAGLVGQSTGVTALRP